MTSLVDPAILRAAGPHTVTVNKEHIVIKIPDTPETVTANAYQNSLVLELSKISYKTIDSPYICVTIRHIGKPITAKK